MNASAWLQSKMLVKIEDHINIVYSLGKEGIQFLEKGLPEKIALKLISDKGGQATLKDLSKILDTQNISVAVGWLRKKDWATIIKEKDTIFQITENGKEALKVDSDEERILYQLNTTPNIELDKNKIKSLLSRKNVIKEKEVITSSIILTENGKEVLRRSIEVNHPLHHSSPFPWKWLRNRTKEPRFLYQKSIIITRY